VHLRDHRLGVEADRDLEQGLGAEAPRRPPSRQPHGRRHRLRCLGVIVSDALPDPDRIIVNIDGIWVTTLDAAPDLAVLLRDAVVQVAAARGVRGRRDDLKGAVYDYMVGPEFSGRVTVIVENLQKMRSGIDLERRALNARLSERETQLDTVVIEFAGIYGDLRGLGSALPPIQTLELPAPETNGELPPAS
jgi:hypothetical protein